MYVNLCCRLELHARLENPIVTIVAKELNGLQKRVMVVSETLKNRSQDTMKMKSGKKNLKPHSSGRSIQNNRQLNSTGQSNRVGI